MAGSGTRRTTRSTNIGTRRTTSRGTGRSRARETRNAALNTPTSRAPELNIPQDNAQDTSQDVLPSQGPQQDAAIVGVSDLPFDNQITSSTPDLTTSRNDQVDSTLPSEPEHTGLHPQLWPGNTAPMTQNDNLFGIAEDINNWMRENLGRNSSTMGGLAAGCDFFADLFEETARSIEDQNMDLFEGAIAPPPTPATFMAPAPAGFLAPQATNVPLTINPNDLTQLDLDACEEVMRWATTGVANEPPIAHPPAELVQPLCIHADCPMAGIYHHEGVYVHNNTPAANYLATFGPSNPPPGVWQAILNGCHGVGTQQDADRISRFIEYHAIGGNFLIAPHTNFLWGEEANAPQAAVRGGAPVIRLPFPAMPLRIHFDASLNMPQAPITSSEMTAQGQVYHRCTDTTCPILEEHGQGMYRHNNLPPRIASKTFGRSSPPEYIWAAFNRVVRAQAYGLPASHADRWTVANYQRLHVDGAVSM
ncbi:MAG: hypothetical protein Q9216_007159 [Gyalolechia sp. 2 TL-2023]